MSKPCRHLHQFIRRRVRTRIRPGHVLPDADLSRRRDRFAVTALDVSWLIGPHHRTKVKLMPYESGMTRSATPGNNSTSSLLIAILFLVSTWSCSFSTPGR